MERGGGGAGGKYCSSERANDAQESRFVMGRDETLSLPFFLLLLPPLSRWDGIHRLILPIEISHFIGLFFCIVHKNILSIGESLPYRMNRGGKRGKLCNNLPLLCSSSQSVGRQAHIAGVEKCFRFTSLEEEAGGGRGKPLERFEFRTFARIFALCVLGNWRESSCTHPRAHCRADAS